MFRLSNFTIFYQVSKFKNRETTKKRWRYLDKDYNKKDFKYPFKIT